MFSFLLRYVGAKCGGGFVFSFLLRCSMCSMCSMCSISILMLVNCLLNCLQQCHELPCSVPIVRALTADLSCFLSCPVAKSAAAARSDHVLQYTNDSINAPTHRRTKCTKHTTRSCGSVCNKQPTHKHATCTSCGTSHSRAMNAPAARPPCKCVMSSR